MNKFLRNGIVLPVALGTLLATSLGAAASPRDKSDQDRQELRQDKRKDKKEARQERREDRKEARQERREDRRDAATPVIVRPGQPAIVRQDIRRNDVRQERRENRRDQRQDVRQDRREFRQDQRQDRREAKQEIRQDRREFRQDQRQDRRARQRYRDDYYRRLRTLQSRSYTPYYYHSGNYRYHRGGNWYRVNYYGADMLRRAIDQGQRSHHHFHGRHDSSGVAGAD